MPEFPALPSLIPDEERLVEKSPEPREQLFSHVLLKPGGGGAHL